LWQWAGPPYSFDNYDFISTKGPTVSTPGSDQFVFNGTNLTTAAVTFCVDYEIFSFAGSGMIGRTFSIVMPTSSGPWDRKTPDNYGGVNIGQHTECTDGSADAFVRPNRDFQAALQIWNPGATIRLNRAEVCLQ
jgi:hypothetical protein